MTYKEAIMAALGDALEKIDEYGKLVEQRTTAEQFNVTKNASDFVGCLTNLAFLATAQSFVNIELNKSSFIGMIPLLFIGVFFLVVQLYLSINLSQTVYKIASDLHERLMNLTDPGSRKTSAATYAILAVTQLLYFLLVRYISRMVETHLG